MGFFDQAKDMYQLQRQAKEIKKELKNIHVEAETDGLKLVIDGEQQFLEAVVPQALCGDPIRLGKAFIDAANKAVKKSQQIGAEKMKGIMGGLFNSGN